MAHPNIAALEELLWPRGFRRDVWMIVDAARDRRVFNLLVNSYLDYSCLYSGTIPPALEVAAPYLVQMEFEDRYTRQLLEQGWGNSWGVILRCDSTRDRVRRHLRKFLLVQDPRGHRLVFRYYDPRVLRAYLPTCNYGELNTVFGPIESFYVEDEDPRQVWEFQREGSQLRRTKSALAAARRAG